MSLDTMDNESGLEHFILVEKPNFIWAYNI